MVLGFSSVLKADFSSRFTLILSEEQPGLFTSDYLCSLLKNQAAAGNSNINLVTFVYRNLEQVANVTLHDFVRKPFSDLEKLFSQLKTALFSEKRNILIMDDVSVFSAYTGRCSERSYNFFKCISRLYAQTLLFCTVRSIGREEISMLCNLAEHVVILKNSVESERQFPCNILNLKSSGKTILEQTAFEVQSGNVVEVQTKLEASGKILGPADDVMRSLTTFKLTLEDDEKESRSKLHLPYLDAQRTTVPDPMDDFYDDDEEDEDD